MNRSLTILILVLSLSFGVTAGTLFGYRSSLATETYEVYVNPGPSTNSLTCGFHVTCDETVYPDTNRTALDWGNSGTASVYWRSFGYLSVGSLATIATGKVWDVTDSCKAVAVEIYSLANTYRGAAGYLHSSLSGTDGRSFYIPGSTTGAYKLEGPVATTASTEIGGCPWDAAHLHQFSDVSGWFRNSGIYSDEPATGTGYDLTDGDNWQNRRPWSE